MALWSVLRMPSLIEIGIYLIGILHPAIFIVLVLLLELVVNIICGVLGIICIQGLRTQSPEKVHYYGKLKMWEFPLKVFRETFAMMFYCDDLYDTCHPFALMTIWMVATSIRFYFTYII